MTREIITFPLIATVCVGDGFAHLVTCCNGSALRAFSGSTLGAWSQRLSCLTGGCGRVNLSPKALHANTFSGSFEMIVSDSTSECLAPAWMPPEETRQFVGALIISCQLPVSCGPTYFLGKGVSPLPVLHNLRVDPPRRSPGKRFPVLGFCCVEV